MTLQDAAQSMRENAKKLRAWAQALEQYRNGVPVMTAEDVRLFAKVLSREAERMLCDAEHCERPAPLEVAS